MASQFLSLEDAAKKLGVTPDRLVELRSLGRIRGFRDGASWKFPENELERLADDLASESGDYDPYKGLDDDQDSDDFSTSGGGSGVLVDEAGTGSSGGKRVSKIIGGDSASDSGIGSDVGIGAEELVRSGSDVNLIAGDSNGSDVKIVSAGLDASDSDDFQIEGGKGGLVEIDSGELQLSANEPAITHDSGYLDLAIEPNAGSTGPITDKELREVADANPDLMVGKKASSSGSGLAFDQDDEDSGDDLIGIQSDADVLGSDFDLTPRASDSSGIGLGSSKSRAGASSLELMDDLDIMGGSNSSLAAGRSSRGVDVLSELDLLGAEAGDSGLISGDSGNVLGSGGLGSGIGVGSSGSGLGSKGSGLHFDDALADDDDLVIADDEDDLVLGGGASDVSVSGDSGINLMSPSDSGLSLESEPLDLAGSSISALDLGAELGSDIGSGSGGSGPSKSGRGSNVSFDGGEDFRLSPSGIGFETDAESNSQVIEIEDSSAFADADAFEEAGFDQEMPAEGGFVEEAADGGFAEEVADSENVIGVTPTRATRTRASAGPVFEVPFSIFQVGMLLVTLLIMSIGGMLMTDLLRNMWAYTDTAAPVSSLTDALISLANLDG